MTEPVAYMYRDFDNKDDDCGPSLQFNEPSPTWDIIEELYTKEQLQPRVKMTQAEFDEFHDLFEVVDYASIALATIQHVKDDFNKLGLKVYSGTVNERIKKENEFNVLWANYDADNPEETIEIVPNKKWFVRSRELAKNSKYIWLCDAEYLDVPQCMFTNYDQLTAMGFDTKEEAEQWTNPLTEAVQLPVEGE